MYDSGLETFRHSQRSHALPVFIAYPPPRVHRSVSSTNIATPGPAPTLLIHRLDLHTSTPELSTLVQRDITSVGDALQFARDEEALVLFGESEGRGVSRLENGNRMHGKLKAKRNHDRNWWPCVKCKEKKLKCVRQNPGHKDSVCKRCQEAGSQFQCKSYNQHSYSIAQARRTHCPVPITDPRTVSCSPGKYDDARLFQGYNHTFASSGTMRSHSPIHGAGVGRTNTITGQAGTERVKYLDRLDGHSKVAFKLRDDGGDHRLSGLPYQRMDPGPKDNFFLGQVQLEQTPAKMSTTPVSVPLPRTAPTNHSDSQSPRPHYLSGVAPELARPASSSRFVSPPSSSPATTPLSPKMTVNCDSSSDADDGIVVSEHTMCAATTAQQRIGARHRESREGSRINQVNRIRTRARYDPDPDPGPNAGHDVSARRACEDHASGCGIDSSLSLPRLQPVREWSTVWSPSRDHDHEQGESSTRASVSGLGLWGVVRPDHEETNTGMTEVRDEAKGHGSDRQPPPRMHLDRLLDPVPRRRRKGPLRPWTPNP